MKVIKYPLSNEKSINMMESENKLAFIVDRHAAKPQIQDALEDMLDCQVTDVNTMITPQGKKKAYVKFHDDTPAIEIATNLGIM
jgi:large subunit ribosomal protein L23